MTCLETDFVVDLLRNKRQARLKLTELENSDEPLTITPITLTELFKGAYSAHDVDSALFKVDEVTRNLHVLNYDMFAAKKAGELLSHLEKSGSRIGDFDTVIAAICLRYEEALVTKNKKHFSRAKGLSIIDY